MGRSSLALKPIVTGIGVEMDPVNRAREQSTVHIVVYQPFQAALPATPYLMCRYVIWVVAIHQIWGCGTSNMTSQVPQI